MEHGFVDYYGLALNSDANYFLIDKQIQNKIDDFLWIRHLTLQLTEEQSSIFKMGDIFLIGLSILDRNDTFLIYGAGGIESISKLGGELNLTVAKPYPFLHPVQFVSHEVYWNTPTFQKLGNGVIKLDRNHLINMPHDNSNANRIEEHIELMNQIALGNYFVEDVVSTQTVRRGQHIFANKVKGNYGLQCAITGISELAFLHASHIKPWSNEQHKGAA
jgi:putative restriction endonuclease